VATLVATGCATASVWQWHRHQTRSAAVAVVERNLDAPVVPVDQLLTAGEPVTGNEVWHSVTASGRYLPGSTVLLRNRPVGGAQGFHVLAGFRIESGRLAGTVLVVDRGWVPTAADGASPESVPDLPDGPVDLVARLRIDELAHDRDAPAGQVQVINAETVRKAAAPPWTGTTLGAYAAVVSENAVPPRLGALEQPSTDLGPHLSYAFQWAVFGIGAFVGAVILLLRDEPSPGSPVTTAPGRERGRRRPTAEQEEDDLLDAQESAAER